MTDPPLTAQQLDRMMVATFGPEYRTKAIVTLDGCFPLREVFAECGLLDPREPPRPASFGLWQMTPSPRTTAP